MTNSKVVRVGKKIILEEDGFVHWTEPIPGNYNHKYAMASYKGIGFCRFPYSRYMSDHVGDLSCNISNHFSMDLNHYWVGIYTRNHEKPGDTIFVARKEFATLKEAVIWAVTKMFELNNMPL